MGCKNGFSLANDLNVVARHFKKNSWWLSGRVSEHAVLEHNVMRLLES